MKLKVKLPESIDTVVYSLKRLYIYIIYYYSAIWYIQIIQYMCLVLYTASLHRLTKHFSNNFGIDYVFFIETLGLEIKYLSSGSHF
jgi:hypothetical protein